MLFDVHAMTPADFDAWLAGQDRRRRTRRRRRRRAAVQPAGPALPDQRRSTSRSSRRALTAAADKPFQIDFDNKDAGIPHNVAIHKDSPTGEEVFKGEIFPGPSKRRVRRARRSPAGAYAFVCTVHPTMTGTLTVE